MNEHRDIPDLINTHLAGLLHIVRASNGLRATAVSWTKSDSPRPELSRQKHDYHHALPSACSPEYFWCQVDRSSCMNSRF